MPRSSSRHGHGLHGRREPAAYLVAVAALKAAWHRRSAIQLSAEDQPGGAPEELTLIEADLRDPRSVALPEQVHPDPALLQPAPQFVKSGETIETRFPTQYSSLSALRHRVAPESLNNVTWRTAAPAGVVRLCPDPPGVKS